MNYKIDYKFARPQTNLFYKVIPQNGAFTIGDTIDSFPGECFFDVVLVQNGKVMDVATRASKTVIIDKKTFPHLKKGLFSKKVKGYALLAFRGVVDIFTPGYRISKDYFYTDDWGNKYGLELNVCLTNVTYNHEKIAAAAEKVNESGPLKFSLAKWFDTDAYAVFKEEWDKAIKENPLLLKNAFDKEKMAFAPIKYDQVPIGILDIFDRFDKRVGDLIRNRIGINAYVRVELKDGENGENLKPL